MYIGYMNSQCFSWGPNTGCIYIFGGGPNTRGVYIWLWWSNVSYEHLFAGVEGAGEGQSSTVPGSLQWLEQNV